MQQTEIESVSLQSNTTITGTPVIINHSQPLKMETTEIDILLIEDNPHEAQLTIRALKKQNLANHLLHIDDGMEALDFLFGNGKYEGQEAGGNLKLIFLDLKLPKIGGIEILRQIKSDIRTRMIPIVVLTSSREEQDLFNSYKFGANSYIVKPVEFEQFSKAVGEAGLYWLKLNVPFTLSETLGGNSFS